MQREESRELQNKKAGRGDREELRRITERQWSVKGNKWEYPGKVSPRPH